MSWGTGLIRGGVRGVRGGWGACSSKGLRIRGISTTPRLRTPPKPASAAAPAHPAGPSPAQPAHPSAIPPIPTLSTSNTNPPLPSASQEIQAATTQSLRQVFRHLPHPAVILTTAALPHSPFSFRGITLSSFTSFSLSNDHAPLVSFNIRTPSRASVAMRKSGVWCVHVLEKGSYAARIAGREGFAGGINRPPPALENGDEAEVEIPIEKQQLGREWQAVGPDLSICERGLPVLSKGVLARIHCRTFREPVEIVDHELWIGEVVRVERVEDLEERSVLAYCGGKFVGVGEEVKEEEGDL